MNIWSGAYPTGHILAFYRCEMNGDIFYLNTTSGSIHGSVTPSLTTCFGKVYTFTHSAQDHSWSAKGKLSMSDLSCTNQVLDK